MRDVVVAEKLNVAGFELELQLHGRIGRAAVQQIHRLDHFIG